jgi:GNAT superfamily N-acetyltransferase
MLALNTVPHIHEKIDNVTITIRPMTLQDTEIESNFVHNLSFESKHNRFLEGINELSTTMLKRLCDIDGKTAMAFIATIQHQTKEQQIGVSRYASNPDTNESEMAVTVADEWQRKGIAKLLMKPLIEYAKNNGVITLYSIDFANNTAMHYLAKDLGMSCEKVAEDARLLKYSLKI